MENRRPPRSSSSGPSKYYDRPQGSGPARYNGQNPIADGNSGNSKFADRRPGTPTRGRGPGPDRPFGDRTQRNNPNLNPRGRFGPKAPPARSKAPLPPVAPVKITSDLQLMDGKFFGKLMGNSPSPRALSMPRSARDSMFRIIARRVRGGRFLDLCAGCGMMGLEAISRGAMLSTFVERSARAATFLRKNVAELGIKAGHAEVIEMEASPFLKRSAGRKRTWDIVFLSNTGGPDDAELLSLVSRGRMIERGGIAVIEHAPESELPQTLGVLTQWRTISKDGVSLTFFNRK